MKIDNKTLLLIGGVLFSYFIFRKKKPTIFGGNCASTYGPQGLEFEGKCQKCPEIVTQNGSAAPTSFQNECMKTGRSRGNLGDTIDFRQMKMTPSATSQEDCAYGFTYQPQKIIPVQCITAPCPPMKNPAMCVRNRKSMLDAKIKQVGNWTPNDTSCTPCTTMAYEGGRGTMRIHKSWCDINCTEAIDFNQKLKALPKWWKDRVMY